MSNWKYKDYSFSSECNYFRVTRGSESSTDNLEEGICTISYPDNDICFTRKFKTYNFTYFGATYKCISVLPLSLRIFVVTSDEITSGYSYVEGTLTLLINSDQPVTIITDYLVGSGFFELVSGEPTNYSYCRLLLDKDIIFNEFKEPLDYAKTRKLYNADMTSQIAGVYNYWENYFKGEFEFHNALSLQETSARDLAIINYDSYLTNYRRVWPHFKTDIQQYEVPFTLRLLFSSITKFERVLADILSLKYVTNIVRIPVIDKNNVEWVIPLRWDAEVTTNNYDTPDHDGAFSWEIVLKYVSNILTVRDYKNVVIEEIDLAITTILNNSRRYDEITIK